MASHQMSASIHPPIDLVSNAAVLGWYIYVWGRVILVQCVRMVFTAGYCSAFLKADWPGMH